MPFNGVTQNWPLEQNKISPIPDRLSRTTEFRKKGYLKAIKEAVLYDLWSNFSPTGNTDDIYNILATSYYDIYLTQFYVYSHNDSEHYIETHPQQMIDAFHNTLVAYFDTVYLYLAPLFFLVGSGDSLILIYMQRIRNMYNLDITDQELEEQSTVNTFHDFQTEAILKNKLDLVNACVNFAVKRKWTSVLQWRANIPS